MMSANHGTLPVVKAHHQSEESHIIKANAQNASSSRQPLPSHQGGCRRDGRPRNGHVSQQASDRVSDNRDDLSVKLKKSRRPLS